MKNLTVSFCLCLLGGLALPAVAIENSALGTNDTSIMNNLIIDNASRGAMQKMQADLDNILNCQKQQKLWDGSTCVAIVAADGNAGLVTDTAVLPTQMMAVQKVNGTVPTGTPVVAAVGSRNCGIFGMDTCESATCQQAQTCADFDVLPGVQLVNVNGVNKIQITPKICQITYRALPSC